MPQEPLRLDHLALRGLEHLCRTYCDPHAKFPLWENGLGLIAEKLIEHSPIPKHPIISVQIGNITIPMELCGGILRYVRLLPSGEVDRAGS